MAKNYLTTDEIEELAQLEQLIKGQKHQ